ncbi:hypothetical protein [Rubrobacter aplysinae]|nr:hypothetical protein [Rubrobacter aplysinae]
MRGEDEHVAREELRATRGSENSESLDSIPRRRAVPRTMVSASRYPR